MGVSHLQLQGPVSGNSNFKEPVQIRPADASDLRFRIMPDGQRPRCRAPLAGVHQTALLT
jgi:hypothetical protein